MKCISVTSTIVQWSVSVYYTEAGVESYPDYAQFTGPQAVWFIPQGLQVALQGRQWWGIWHGRISRDISVYCLPLGPEHTGHFVQPHVAAHCGGDIYSRRKPLFSSFGEHTAVCGSSVRQAVARPRHRQSVCIHNIHVAATCRPSVLGSATKTRPHVVEQSGQCARALTSTFGSTIDYFKNFGILH